MADSCQCSSFNIILLQPHNIGSHPSNNKENEKINEPQKGNERYVCEREREGEEGDWELCRGGKDRVKKSTTPREKNQTNCY